MRYVPSVWFLDLNQLLLARGSQQLGKGQFCLGITAVTLVLSIAVYALTYYREYMRIPERGGEAYGRGRDDYSLVRRFLDVTVLRSPFQCATYHFSVKTLFRSERHCLVFGTATAIGLFVAFQDAAGISSNPLDQGIDAGMLSISLTIAYAAIVSLRALFDLPGERKANWIFQSIVDVHQHDGRGTATKLAISAVIPWLILPALPLHILRLGWSTALLHTAYVLTCSMALAELLLIRFRKIPFTCLHTASKDKVLVSVILGIAGLSLFSGVNSSIEARLLQHPLRFFEAFLFFCALFLGIRIYRSRLSREDRALLFEDRPAPLVQLLNLSE
jgi:hypothetical protein